MKEFVALRLDLGIPSITSDYPVKIFGNELSREIHDMNCDLMASALKIANRVTHDQKPLSRNESNTLRCSAAGKAILARIRLSEGAFMPAVKFFEEAYEETKNVGFKFESCVASILKYKYAAEKEPDGKSERTRRRYHVGLKSSERVLESLVLSNDHAAAHFLSVFIEQSKQKNAKKTIGMTKELLFRGLKASTLYNVENVNEKPNVFGLSDFGTKVRHSVKDRLMPSAEILSVPSKSEIKTLLLDIFRDHAENPLLFPEDIVYLNEIYGTLIGKSEIREEDWREGIFLSDNPDLERYQLKRIVIDCINQTV